MYAVDGAYEVNVTCNNNVSFGTYQYTQYVEYPITNLQLDKASALVNTPFTVNFKVTRATAPTFSLTFDGTPYLVNYGTPTALRGVTRNTFPAFSSIGLHYVTVGLLILARGGRCDKYLCICIRVVLKEIKCGWMDGIMDR